jgi:hypothetical protein
MPKPSGDGSAERRKSFAFFPLPLPNGLTAAHDAGPEASTGKLKKQRPASFFSASSLSVFDGDGSEGTGQKQPPSPNLRPGRLTKSARPSSIFGSWKLTPASEDTLLRPTPSKDSWTDEGKGASAPAPGKVVLHHGEVQTTGGMFRKRKEYLVLTDKQLLRFKSRSRAAEAFPW